MAWYKFCKDYIQSIYDQQIQAEEKDKFTNSDQNTEIDLVDPTTFTLEGSLNKVRHNKIENPKLQNEVRQPIRTKANGQGQDGILKMNQDLPIYGDNFTRATDWNTG